ncbi:DUF4907 domain-containing protein [Labilibacter sediminis]|nr:DUF4907 domain-containing protein [Labilibacter sediminis]
MLPQEVMEVTLLMMYGSLILRKNMKAKTKTLFTLIVAFALLSCSSKTKSNDISLVTFVNGNNWVYEIYINDKCIIHQDYIPSIPGKIAFKSKKDAELVGNLVMKKIMLKETPTVNTGELKQLGIKGTS